MNGLSCFNYFSQQMISNHLWPSLNLFMKTSVYQSLPSIGTLTYEDNSSLYCNQAEQDLLSSYSAHHALTNATEDLLSFFVKSKSTSKLVEKENYLNYQNLFLVNLWSLTTIIIQTMPLRITENIRIYSYLQGQDFKSRFIKYRCVHSKFNKDLILKIRSLALTACPLKPLH